MLKYLYVLVSDENDYYLEQAFLSITSLRMRMPEGFVSLLIDDSTERNLTDKRRNILDIINELKVIKINGTFNKKERSRWLKTSMRQHIEGDFLFIDCDTIIADDLSTITDCNADLGAVFDKHVLLDNHHMKSFIQKNDKRLGFNSSFISNIHFNSGVMFCRDIPVCHVFFDEWHKLWLMGMSIKSIDQPSLNQANIYCNKIITELDGIWNCQITYGGIAYLANAKIIHYFASDDIGENPYLLAKSTFLRQIKEIGSIPQEIIEMLKVPKSVFNCTTRLISDKEILPVIDSSIILIVKKMFKSKLIIFFDFIIFKLFCLNKLFKNMTFGNK